MGLDALVRCRCTHGCAHAGGALASVRIANWPDYRLFQQALREAGSHHFPVLSSRLPDIGAGTLTPEHAATALAELRYFTEEADQGSQTWLIDDRTDALLIAAVPSYGGVVVWAGRSRHKLGADSDGFFVRRCGADEHEVFRAQYFHQEVADRNWVRFTNLDTDATVAVAMRQPLGCADSEYPRRLRVDTVLVGADDFTAIVDPLTVILRAAVATGIPVTWQ
jgi:hypothetical protein